MVRLVVMPRPYGLAQCDLDAYQAYPPGPGAAVMVDGLDDEAAWTPATRSTVPLRPGLRQRPSEGSIGAGRAVGAEGHACHDRRESRCGGLGGGIGLTLACGEGCPCDLIPAWRRARRLSRWVRCSRPCLSQPPGPRPCTRVAGKPPPRRQGMSRGRVLPAGHPVCPDAGPVVSGGAQRSRRARSTRSSVW